MSGYAPVSDGKSNNEALIEGQAYAGRPIPAQASLNGDGYGEPVVSVAPAPGVVQAQPVQTEGAPLQGHNPYGQPVYNAPAQEVAYAIPVQEAPMGAAGRQAENGYWPTHLFGCFENPVPSCLMACCCWCFPLARVRAHAHIENPSCNGYPGSNWGYNIGFLATLFVLHQIFWFLRSILFFDVLGMICQIILIFFVCVTRMEFRRSKGITENCCCCEDTIFDDFFSSCCCTCCVIAQMDRIEFNYRDGCNDCGRAFSNPLPEAGVPGPAHAAVPVAP
uniref:PLAC8 family protein n=1 Tax=Lotharella oceanica TaxID=641309 RepID=A0A7S2XC94_9EUKA|mmetsp:Transcript_28322/g.52900  ORF Transcript_28322/g.52900 Transcript_28322/m.52900 type:complete len:277 (+) Transcript_28322:59-889(+)